MELPPKWADKFLVWYCNPELLEEIQGDAHELYFERVRLEGKSSADRKYIWDVIRFCRWSNIKKSQDEFKPDYFKILWNLNFKIAIRNALSNKLVFSVKMVGLSICLAFALVVSAFVIQEFRYDNFHRDHDRIFRVSTRVEMHGVNTNYAVSPVALSDALADEIPEIESVFRMVYGGKPFFTLEENLYNDEQTLEVSEDFLRSMTFDFVQGASDALDEPNKIILTQTTARKFFGDKDPVGQIIDLPWTQLEVTGVLADVPENSHLKFSALISWSTFDVNEGWDNINAYTYFKLRAGASIQDVEPKINELFLNHRADIEAAKEYRLGEEISIAPIVENITDIHLGEFLDEDIADKREKTNVYILVAVVALFFLTGLINFLNLSLAELTTNLKKIGILQVFGGAAANHGKVIITNVLLNVFIILPLSAMLVYGSILLAESFFSIFIEPSVFVSPLFLMTITTFMLILVFSSKINAFVLARSNDLINSLKGKLNAKPNGFQLRELLVATQLSFSILMIALIVIIVDQFHYINTRDKGFEDKNTIVIQLRSHEFVDAETFQESIRKLSGVKKVDGGSFYLDNVETKEFFEVEMKEGKKKMLVAYMNCGYDYLDALGIHLTKGRNFSPEHRLDDQSYIINETAARNFGWKDPIGKSIWGPMGTDRDEGQIIGVVKDFNFTSLHKKIEPLIIFPATAGWGIRYVYVKVNPVHPSNLITQIEKEYKRSYGDLPLEWEYLDSKYASLYRDDLEIRNVFQVGLFISILISCLGVFSISALIVLMRAKEMGIRKVIGANSIQLFGLHMKSFLKFMVIAVVIAWPMIYLLSKYWLENFAYHIDLNAWYYIVPGLMTFLIVLVISGYHGVRNSQVNPVDILKHE